MDAAQSVCDLPVMCTLSVEADGKALFGENAVEAVMILQEMEALAIGVNCSVGLDLLGAVIASMKAVANIPIIAKPNVEIYSESKKCFSPLLTLYLHIVLVGRDKISDYQKQILAINLIGAH